MLRIEMDDWNKEGWENEEIRAKEGVANLRQNIEKWNWDG